MQHKSIKVYTIEDFDSLLAQYGTVTIPKHHAFFLSGYNSVSLSTGILTVQIKNTNGSTTTQTLRILQGQFEYIPLVISSIDSFTSSGSLGDRRNISITFLR